MPFIDEKRLEKLVNMKAAECLDKCRRMNKCKRRQAEICKAMGLSSKSLQRYKKQAYQLQQRKPQQVVTVSSEHKPIYIHKDEGGFCNNDIVNMSDSQSLEHKDKEPHEVCPLNGSEQQPIIPPEVAVPEPPTDTEVVVQDVDEVPKKKKICPPPAIGWGYVKEDWNDE